MDNNGFNREQANAVAEATVERLAARIPTMQELERKIEISVQGAVSTAAAQAAEIAVSKTLISFGLDPKNQMEIMRNFIFLDDMRKVSAASKKHVVLAVVGLLVTFAVTAVVAYVKTSVH